MIAKLNNCCYSPVKRIYSEGFDHEFEKNLFRHFDCGGCRHCRQHVYRHQFIPVSLGILQSMIVDWKIFVPALVCAFAFSKVKYYWLTMLGCSFVTSMVVQVFFFSVKAGLYIICLRAFCFLVVVYIVDYLRLIGKRK